MSLHRLSVCGGTFAIATLGSVSAASSIAPPGKAEIASTIAAARLQMPATDVSYRLVQTTANTSMWAVIDERVRFEAGGERFRLESERGWATGDSSLELTAWNGNEGVRANLRASGAVISANPGHEFLHLDVGSTEFLRLLRVDPFGSAGMGGDLLALLASPGSSLRANVEEAEGHPCAVLDHHDEVSGQLIETLWLAWDAGWAPVRHVMVVGGEIPVRVFRVKELAQIGGGGWLPMKAEIQYPVAPGGMEVETAFDLEVLRTELGPDVELALAARPESLLGEGVQILYADRASIGGTRSDSTSDGERLTSGAPSSGSGSSDRTVLLAAAAALLGCVPVALLALRRA